MTENFRSLCADMKNMFSGDLGIPDVDLMLDIPDYDFDDGLVTSGPVEALDLEWTSKDFFIRSDEVTNEITNGLLTDFTVGMTNEIQKCFDSENKEDDFVIAEDDDEEKRTTMPIVKEKLQTSSGPKVTLVDIFSTQEQSKMKEKALKSLQSKRITFNDSRDVDPNLHSLRQFSNPVKFRKSITVVLSDMLLLGEDQFWILDRIGDGRSSSVFKAEKLDENMTMDVGITRQLQTSNENLRAIKWVQEPTVWEFYVLNEMRIRSFEIRNQTEYDTTILPLESLHLYRSNTFLITPYLSNGTLYDLVFPDRTNPLQTKKILSEELTLFYAYEVLKAVELCHLCGVIHFNIHLNNFLVKSGRMSDAKNLKIWNGKSDGGWEKFGVNLINFGQSIDVYLFSENVRFIGGGGECVGELQHPNVRSGKAWGYEVDTFAVASVIHMLLFGENLNVGGDENGNLKLKRDFKSAQQKEVWGPIFEMLLGCDGSVSVGDKSSPLSSVVCLRECQKHIEMIFRSTPLKAKRLHMEIMKQTTQLATLKTLIKS
jgi:hypothetical protein